MKLIEINVKLNGIVFTVKGYFNFGRGETDSQPGEPGSFTEYYIFHEYENITDFLSEEVKAKIYNFAVENIVKKYRGGR